MKTVWILLTLIGLLLHQGAMAQTGLTGEYYNGTNFEQKVLTRVDAQISFDWRNRLPARGMGVSYYSVRWTGKLLAPVSGQYIFSALVDDGIRVWVGNKKIIDAWGLHDDVSVVGKVMLEVGKYYDLRVDYFNDMLEGKINLLWHRPDETTKNPPFRDQFGRIIGDPTTYHPITGQFLFRTLPPPLPKPVVVLPKPAPKPVTPIAIVPKAKPVTRPVARPVISQPAPSKPAPASTPDSFDPLDVGKSLVLQSVFFEQSTCTLLPASFTELDSLVKSLQQNPTIRIEISGHTDNVGDPRLNQALSEYRARVVMNYLIRHGIADDRVEAKGYGDSRPLTGNATESERAQNRRVEFLVK